MVKRKPTRRGASESLASPREKQSQDAPVTDTVMQVITRRIRNARKKLQKVTVIEELLEKSHTLNEDQERVYMTKTPLSAVIEELLKLEPLVEAALANEMEERMKSVKEQLKGESSMPADATHLTSETGDSEATVEGPSRSKLEEPEEEEEENETGETTGVSATPPPSYEEAAEALYFLQLFAKRRFDLTPFISDETGEQGILNAEEVEALESFGRRMFQMTPHTPQDGLESVKEAMHLLLSRSDDETGKGTAQTERCDAHVTSVFDAVSKLKASEVMTMELKPTVHGFPITIDKEESDTITEPSEEHPKTEIIQTETTPQSEIPPPTEENPPPSSPVHPSPPAYMPEVVHMPPKSPRPFLPFPGVALSGGPPVGYTMTQAPMMGMHSFFSMAPVSGSYMQPVPYHPTAPPPTDMPPLTHEHTSEPPVETGHIESNDNDDIDDRQSPTRGHSLSVQPTHLCTQMQLPTSFLKRPTLHHPKKPSQHLQVMPLFHTPCRMMFLESSAQIGGDAQQPSAIVRPRPAGGRFEGDYRPYQGGRGRYPYPANRQAPRGRGRGRHPYSYAPRRPYDSSNPTHRPFLPDRHPYDRRRRGGYQ